MTIATITPKELNERVQSGQATEILDVRTPAEFRAVRAKNVVNIPLDQLKPAEFISKRGDSSEPLYVICKMGGRSLKACEALAAAGLTNVVNVTGGTDQWVADGLPAEQDETTRKIMSIERQVRIVAGTIVLAGTLLSFYNPWFLVWPGLIGVGFIFSGLSNTCGMGMMLARLPWNR